MTEPTQQYLPSEVDDLLQECVRDTKVYGKLFYPESLYAPFAEPHNIIVDMMDDERIEYGVIAAPRGTGKTTLMKILCCKAIHFQMARFIVYISKSEGHAIMQTEDIKRKLLGSDLGKQWFPPIKVKDQNGLGEEFSKKTWVAGGHTIVVPRGSGQQVRGLNWNDYRPDLIIVDDLEDTQTLGNETIRKQRYDWFYSDVLEARPQIRGAEFAKQSFKLIYIDTVKHEDSLIESLLIDEKFERIRLRVCDENYRTLYPNHMDQETLDAKIADHREKRTMDIFAREWLCEATSREDATFKGEFFQYYKETDQEFQDRDRAGQIENILIVDPAKTEKMHNAQSGIVVWGFDSAKNALYVREARGEFYTPDQLYDDMFKTAQHYKVKVIGVETAGLDEFIRQPIMNEMSRRRLNFNLFWCKARRGKQELAGEEGGKIGRIAALIPYYRRGQVFHNEVGIGAYEQQLLSYPRSKRWDIMDAAAYVVQILLEGERFFSYLPQSEQEQYEMESYGRDTDRLEYYDEPSEFEEAFSYF